MEEDLRCKSLAEADRLGEDNLVEDSLAVEDNLAAVDNLPEGNLTGKEFAVAAQPWSVEQGPEPCLSLSPSDSAARHVESAYTQGPCSTCSQHSFGFLGEPERQHIEEYK